MKIVKLIVPIAVLGCCTLAFAENEADVHTESTNSAGTSVKTDKSHSDTVGLTGTRKIESDTERVTDPKGLNNKVKESAHAKTTIKSDGDVAQEATTVDAAGTKRHVANETDTSKNWSGGKTTTTTHTEVVDPKGLGNKQKVEVESEVATDAHGHTKHVTKKVNGETVSETSEAHH